VKLKDKFKIIKRANKLTILAVVVPKDFELTNIKSLTYFIDSIIQLEQTIN